MRNYSESISSWLSKESNTFSILCGESFTHAEVIATNAVAFLMIAIAVAAGNVFAY